MNPITRRLQIGGRTVQKIVKKYLYNKTLEDRLGRGGMNETAIAKNDVMPVNDFMF